MRRSILILLVVLALVLAGCNGLVPGSDGTPTETVTPAAVPTDEPTVTPVPQLAPGLTGQGVTDAFALGGAHDAILRNTSYTDSENTTVWYANGTVFDHVTVRTQYATNHTRYYTVQNGTGVRVHGSGNTSIWSNGERVAIAQTTNNTTTYNVPRDSDGNTVVPRLFVPSGAGGNRIAALFASTETGVFGRERRNGTTLYRVGAINVTNPAAFEGVWQNPHNVTFRALVTSHGLVREYRLDYTATLNGQLAHVHKRVEYSHLGNTTVERPLWYDDAIANVSTSAPTTTATAGTTAP